MYGIPALYGIIIGIIHSHKNSQHAPNTPLQVTSNEPTIFSKSLLSIIKKSCTENTQSIIILGGYITFTNACRVLLDLIPLNGSHKNILSAFIELTGGVQTIYQTVLSPEFKIFWIMTALSFGGISCFMQTSSFLEKSGLSLAGYMKHKLITTFISAIYYIIIITLPW
jgi:hypothetical protein